MRKIDLFWVLVLMATLVSRGKAASTETIRLEIDPQTVVAPIAEDFLGLGYETSAVAREGFFSATNEHMVNLYRMLTTNGVVRIGGIIGDHTRFEPDGMAKGEAMEGTTVINRRVLMDLGGFLRATGWKAIWTLNLGTGTKEEAATEAVAVKAALGDRLDSMEIGNEVDLLRRFTNYNHYHQTFKEYRAAVQAVYPRVVLSGPDSAVKTAWTTAFARTEAKNTHLLLHHYYRGGMSSPQATIETMLAPHAELEEMLEKLQSVARQVQVRYRINEVNSFSGGGKPDVSDTFASALWCLDFMFRLAAHECAGVNLETDVNQHAFVSHYSPIYRNSDGTLEARPEYYAMLAFAMAGRGDLVEVKMGETKINFAAYATKDAEGLRWLVLLNKDLAQKAKVEFGVGAATALESFALTASSARSKTGVTLGGVEVSPEGVWAMPAAGKKVAVKDGRATVTLPPANAVLIRFR